MWSNEDEVYIGLCAEFSSLSWVASTQDKAFKGIRKLIQDLIADMAENNEEIPEPYFSQ